MKNRNLIIVILVVLGISLGASLSEARELRNNFYFSLPPDSAKCFNVRLTSDINVYEEDRVIINVTTDAETNIKFINVSASPQNQVIVPLCFFSFNRQAGDFSNYAITIFSEKSGIETIKGGFCVANSTAVASGRPEKNPCEFIIRDEKLFDIFFQHGDTAQIKKDTPGKIPIIAYSPNDIDLELTMQGNLNVTPKNHFLRLEKGKRSTFNFEVAPTSPGNYEINLTAEAVVNGKFCDSKKMPFCKKEISAAIGVDTIGLKGWHFYVAPVSYSVFNLRPIQYSATIENYENEREFSLELKLPAGLTSDFTKNTTRIASQERKEFPIDITPQDSSPKNYEIEFIATGDSERSLKSYLSVRDTEARVNDYWSGIRDSVAIDLRPAVEVNIRNFLENYRQDGIDTEEYAGLIDLMQKAERGENISVQIRNITGTLPPKKSEPINPILIIAPVIVIIFIVLIIFYTRARKSKKEDGQL